MMATTKIEWCDRVFNPVTGCSPVSEGCINCYAARMSKRLAGRYGYPADEPFRVTLHPERVSTMEPALQGEGKKIFICSMGDLFHEDVPFEFISDVWDLILECKWNTFLILTKRPSRMLEFSKWYEHWYDDFAADHIWLGVTAENQQRADERIPILLQIPAAVRFVSCEPLLSAIHLSKWLGICKGCGSPATRCGPDLWKKNKKCCPDCTHTDVYLDWVVAGGESGLNARPVHPNWVRSLRDQAVSAGVPFFFKQWGGTNKKKTGRLFNGKTYDEMPLVNSGEVEVIYG